MIGKFKSNNQLTSEYNGYIINVQNNVRNHMEVKQLKAINITQARQNIYNLVNETILNHEPIQILSKQGNAVLVSESDWRAIEETLYLTSIPNMAQSIKDGMNTPIEECEEDLNWDDIE